MFKDNDWNELAKFAKENYDAIIISTDIIQLQKSKLMIKKENRIVLDIGDCKWPTIAQNLKINDIKQLIKILEK